MRKGIQRPTTSTRHRTILLISGIFLSFILLEAALRLGGFALLSIQEHRNRQALKQKGSYRILCLGESTTSKQYPPFLGQALNRSGRGIIFSVIDEGMPAAVTPLILWELPGNLDKYRPDMVVAMMGINDGQLEQQFKAGQFYRPGFIQSLQIYKLFRIIYLRFTCVAGLRPAYAESFYSKDAFGDAIALNPSNYYAYISLGRLYHDEGNVVKSQEMFQKAAELDPLNGDTVDRKKLFAAQKVFEKTVKQNPANTDAYMYLGRFYMDRENYFRAQEVFEQAVKSNPGSQRAYLVLGWFYRSRGNYPQAEAALEKAAQIDPDNPEICHYLGWIYSDEGKYQQAQEALERAIKLDANEVGYRMRVDGVYRKQGKFDQAEKNLKQGIEIFPTATGLYISLASLYLDQGKIPRAQAILEQAIAANPRDDQPYRALSKLYSGLGKISLAKKYVLLADNLHPQYNNLVTASNYLKLKEILDKKGVKLVCVQYPMRSVKPLKMIFRGQEEGIIFVDNEKIFKDAVLKEGYEAYFNDMFAGDFGHCTPKGNRLLAENIARAILKEMF